MSRTGSAAAIVLQIKAKEMSKNAKTEAFMFSMELGQI
jgi:hypothetical protein